MKKCVLDLLKSKGKKSELQLGFRFVVCTHSDCFLVIIAVFCLIELVCFTEFRKPAVIMIVGVNGGGKTTSLGNDIKLLVVIICT